MLVLSRQKDETIIIGDNIEITVVDIRGDKVRLGVSAPKEVSVHRKEVYEAIRRENREAAQVKPEDLSGIGKVKPGPSQQNPPPKIGPQRNGKSLKPESKTPDKKK
jgi:carbon storage regulator